MCLILPCLALVYGFNILVIKIAGLVLLVAKRFGVMFL